VLIDDDDDDWLLFSEAVKKIDGEWLCLFFQDAIAAILFLSGSLKEELPNYIFLDLNMPKMNGKECLMEIKSRKELADISVNILSTSVLENDIRQAKMLGADYYIIKPNKLRLLEDALRFILNGGKSALPDELKKWIKVLAP